MDDAALNGRRSTAQRAARLAQQARKEAAGLRVPQCAPEAPQGGEHASEILPDAASCNSVFQCASRALVAG